MKTVFLMLMATIAIFSLKVTAATTTDCAYSAVVSVFTLDGKPINDKTFSAPVVRKQTQPGNYQFSEVTTKKPGRVDFSLSWAKAPFHVESEKGTVSGVCSSLGYCAGKTIGKSDSKINSTFVTQFDSKFVRTTSVTDSEIVIQELHPKNGECIFK